jgi:hypothetical protein
MMSSNAMQFDTDLQTFRGNLVSSSFGSTSGCHPLLVGFLLSLFSDREDGGDIFLRNVSEFLPNYTVLQPRTSFCS